MKTTLIILLFTVAAFASNIGVWQNGGTDIGVWQDTGSEAEPPLPDVRLDSITNSAGAKVDTGYWLDTIDFCGYWPDRIPDSLKIGDSACTVISYTDTTIRTVIDSGIPIGSYLITIADSASADTLVDSFYVAGERIPSTITLHPVDQYTVIGETAEFTVEASGTGTLSYQWQNNYEGWSDIEHDTLSIKQVPDVTLDVDNVSFRCIVSDAYGAVTSDSATLYVGTAPEITVQPVSDSVYNWKNAYLTIGATGTEPIIKTWQKRNGEWQTVNTGDSLTVIPLDTMTTYRVLISSPWGADISDTANITFFEPVSRRYSWIDSTLSASGLTVPDSGSVGAKINSVNLTLTKWSGGQVIGTVPTGTPAGLYKSPGLWLYQFTGGDTTAIDTLGAVRVLKFQVRSLVE